MHTPYTSVVPAKMQDRSPSPSFTKSSILTETKLSLAACALTLWRMPNWQKRWPKKKNCSKVFQPPAIRQEAQDIGKEGEVCKVNILGMLTIEKRDIVGTWRSGKKINLKGHEQSKNYSSIRNRRRRQCASSNKEKNKYFSKVLQMASSHLNSACKKVGDATKREKF